MEHRHILRKLLHFGPHKTGALHLGGPHYEGLFKTVETAINNTYLKTISILKAKYTHPRPHTNNQCLFEGGIDRNCVFCFSSEVVQVSPFGLPFLHL